MVLNHPCTDEVRDLLSEVVGISEHVRGRSGHVTLEAEELEILKAKLLLLGCERNINSGDVFIISGSRRCTLVIDKKVYQLYKGM